MLNIFPDLLTYSLIGPFILRVSLGLLFLNLGYLCLTSEKGRWQNVFEILRARPTELWTKVLGVLEIAGGILLVVGLFTQGSALFFTLLSLAELRIEYREPVILKRNIIFYMLVFAISLSLVFTGAGFFAFDLPL